MYMESEGNEVSGLWKVSDMKSLVDKIAVGESL